MPIFRIIYIDDDTFVPRTLTAAFADRAAAEIAMAKHGHRVAHMAELGSGESAFEPVHIAMTGGVEPPPASIAPSQHAAARPLLERLGSDVAGVATLLGIAALGAALLFF